MTPTDPDVPLITLAELHALKALKAETTPLPWLGMRDAGSVDGVFALLLVNADPLRTIEHLYRRVWALEASIQTALASPALMGAQDIEALASALDEEQRRRDKEARRG